MDKKGVTFSVFLSYVKLTKIQKIESYFSDLHCLFIFTKNVFLSLVIQPQNLLSSAVGICPYAISILVETILERVGGGDRYCLPR